MLRRTLRRYRNGPCNSMGRLQRQNAFTNRSQFGAIRTEPENLRLRRTAWWGWEMSHVGLDQILTDGAGRNGRFEAKLGFWLLPEPLSPSFGTRGSQVQILHSDQHLAKSSVARHHFRHRYADCHVVFRQYLRQFIAERM